jgi:hypothetical protein
MAPDDPCPAAGKRRPPEASLLNIVERVSRSLRCRDRTVTIVTTHLIEP